MAKMKWHSNIMQNETQFISHGVKDFKQSCCEVPDPKLPYSLCGEKQYSMGNQFFSANTCFCNHFKMHLISLLTSVW